MKYVFQIAYYGYGILIIAAFINWVGKSIGFKSWYDILGELSFRGVAFFNFIWLVTLYPLLLGAGIVFLKFLKKIVRKGKKEGS